MYGWIKRSVEIMTCTLSFKYIMRPLDIEQKAMKYKL